MSILARDPVTGALTLIDSVLPRDVALDLPAGSYDVLPVGNIIGRVNVLDVVFATAPLVSGTVAAGATLTVSGTATAAVAYEYQWLVNGVLIPGATNATYTTDATTDLGKTFTGQMRAQNALGNWTAYMASSNSITIHSPAAYSIPDDEWTSVEDPDDAETRQTYVTANPTVPVPTGKKLRWYKGRTNPTDSSMFIFLSDMVGTAPGIGPYTADGVSLVSVGSVVYSRLAISNLDNTSPEWITSIKNYTTSNVPSAPGEFTATNSTTVTGRVSLDPNDTPPATNGRPILEYGYSQNGGAITAFATGGSATTARDVDFVGVDPIAVRLHARNVNGWSVGSAPVSVTPVVVAPWVIVGTMVEAVPLLGEPFAPTAGGGILSGSEGIYRITNSTTSTVAEVYIIPPFDLADYGSPGDTVTAEYLTFSDEGPEIVLPFIPQIMMTAVGTLARSGATVTLTPATWDTADITVTRQQFINDVPSVLVGTTFTVAAGDSYYVIETASKTGFIASDPAQTLIDTRPTVSPYYVGRKTLSTAGTTSSHIAPLNSIGGVVETSPQPGDLVIVTYSVASAAGFTPVITSEGYQDVATIAGNSVTDVNMVVKYKFMGSTVDTQVDFQSPGSVDNAYSVAIQVWRGVDTTTPFDVTPVTASGTGGRPTPGEITPVTAGAQIMIAAAAAGPTSAAILTSGLTNFSSIARPDTNAIVVGHGTSSWSGGTFTTPTYGGNTTNTSNSWVAITLALRPAQ